jgi:hypothetical protein
MENRIVVKEFRGEEDFWILITDEEIYLNVLMEKKRAIREKIENCEKNIILPEEVTMMKIKNIKEITVKKNSKSIDFISKEEVKATFDADSKEIKSSILSEMQTLLGDKYEMKEIKYTMFRRVITPACYTIIAGILGAICIWLATAQPVIVKRDIIVRRSIATIIKTIQFIEGIGADNARILAMVLVSIPIIYMAIRVVKPPVKIVIESK